MTSEKLILAAAAILIAAAIVTGVAIVESMPRYALVTTPSGPVLRMNLITGRILVCEGPKRGYRDEITFPAVFDCHGT